jgi:circadian clock protein KaiC
MSGKAKIQRLTTGIEGFDDLLGGGVPEFSFNLIAGSPGSGKTTLAHQIMFALASEKRRAIFFTVLGEPPLKMLRYQQQYSFFNMDKINDTVHFVNLADEMVQGDLDAVLARIGQEVKHIRPGIVFVDSFRSVAQAGQASASNRSVDLQRFVQGLGLQMTSWQATTFLIGEHSATSASEGDGNPVFTIADGILWLTQNVDRNSMVRKMQVAKMRGQAPLPGLHTFRIEDDGIHVFPRKPTPPAGAASRALSSSNQRLSLGVPRLDELMGGGLPQGYSLLVTGPSGSGKTVLATTFLAEGARRGEPGVLAVFESNPSRLRSPVLDELVAAGQIIIFDTRRLDLSSDEMLHTLAETVRKSGAKRVVIDSVSGLELALAPSFRDDFRESLYRVVSALMDLDTTVTMTCELEDRFDELRFSPYGAAFLTDAIIVQRYVEIEGVLRRVLAVVKVRNSEHRSELHCYEITPDGIVIGDSLGGYEGLLSGRPHTEA